MVFLSLVLVPTVNRWVNIVLPSLYVVSVVASAIGETSAYYWFLSITESVLLLLVVWYAWTWPRREGAVVDGRLAMTTPPIVSRQEWEAARQQLLVREKELTRARDALAAERRRMPWLAVEKGYEFDGPQGKASLPDLFHGRRQLIVYRAFFEPGVYGWPEHACVGCSMVADQVAHLAHLNARDTTLVFVSRAPQTDIERVKARMGWEMPWYTLT